MVCTDNNRLVVEINQGCPRGFSFTINQKIYNYNTNEYDKQPIDLTGLTINIQIKKAPYYQLPTLINKNITEKEDVTQGQIVDPLNGKFTLQITKQESTFLNPGEYALMIYMIDQDTCTNLSSNKNDYAIYRVCYQ